ncbi:MAG: hydroxyacylglutathione hydrolase [Pseudomonadota bacterium]
MAAHDLQIYQFPCREDNYGIVLRERGGKEAICIDAPEVEPIEDVLADKDLRLHTLLTTHHHYDHVEGNKTLKASHKCTIIGPAEEEDHIPGIDQSVNHGDEIEVMGCRVQVIGTPGHTQGQVAYYLPDARVVFAADALFAMGCGRIFEGDAEMMHTALQRLARLPDDTKVYAGHEYTLSNAKFAVSVDGTNEVLLQRARAVELLRDEGKPTLPTTMLEEKATNPFLRVKDPAIRAHLGMEDADDVEVFAELRARKDRF